MTAQEDESVSWRPIGPVSQPSKKQCRFIYSSNGGDADLCLFYVSGEIYAIDAHSGHSGNCAMQCPLCDGDIEEADGVLQVFCPLHYYDFNLRMGKSSTGLQQQVYGMKLEDGNVYVKHASNLSLQPFGLVKEN
ncbi:uncharacterized protein si:ch211-212d10.2 [Myxocyprinus asiaticus]|uniref:uncharacterized protein si:ch211-212d10.2 n=1 Tax=Myxocyprinus asiaticus TaxID=70543 RepID=UPI00222372D3|nr:uncharacterized protein si:ch211-212d10.2 [Myxocyprinus asiaticus]